MIGSNKRKKKNTWLIFLIIIGPTALICTIIPEIAAMARINDYDYFLKNWLNIMFYIGLISWQATAAAGILYLDRHSVAPIEEVVARIIIRTLLTVACIMVVLGTLFAAMVHAFRYDKSSRNATNTYTYEDWSGNDLEYVLCEDAGPFYLHRLRRMTGPDDIDPDITEAEWIATREAEYQKEKESTEAVKQESYSDEMEDPNPSDEDTSTGSESTVTGDSSEQGDIYYEDEDVHDGYIKIYEKYFKEEGDTFDEQYDAKGNSYVILKDEDAYINYLMYDQESANGKCDIYVLYRSRRNSSTGAVILDMYAYEIETGKVVSSGKKNWTDTGTDEYRKLTGE